jgi:hypothetical protein
MSLVRAIVVSPEEAADGNAEFWCGREQLAVTVLHEGRIHLRVDPRRDGEPWLIDADSLALALRDAEHLIGMY